MKKLRWISRTFLFLSATLAAPSCARVFPDTEIPEAHPPLACYHFSLSASGVSPVNYGTADMLIYDAGSPGLLDAYCKTAAPGPAAVSSRGGDKVIVAVSGTEISSLPFSCFDSMDSFSLLQYSLADEDPSRPVLTASANVRAGGAGTVGLTLRPMLCQVRLLPPKVDFSSRPYPSSALTDIKAYLINVASRACFYDSNDSSDTEIINCGRYDSRAVSSLGFPSMIYAADASGGAVFYCYPRTAAMCLHSAVRPTKLVVEGKIDGHSYYYPVEVASGDMRRGMNYTYELCITRAGSTDPDESAEAGAFTLRAAVSAWEEYDEEYERY